MNEAEDGWVVIHCPQCKTGTVIIMDFDEDGILYGCCDCDITFREEPKEFNVSEAKK